MDKQMEQSQAIECFAALAQESRLSIVRLLVHETPDGLPVTEISQRLGILQSTLSGHLGVLKRTKLLRSTRRQREIIYSADLDEMNALVRFFLEDCCAGNTKNCGQILSLLQA